MLKQTVSSFVKGMNSDFDYLHQPKDTYKTAYNAVSEVKEGYFLDLSTEIGNSPCLKFVNEYSNLLGFQLLDDNSFILFLKGQNHDAIVKQNSDCTIEYLVKSTCLGFNDKYLIDTEYRLYAGCRRIIYFTDGINPVRYISIDDLKTHLPINLVNDTTINTIEEKVVYANNNNIWNCESFKMFPNVKLPIVTFNKVNDYGGRLKIGSYSFAIRYIDADLNPTQWFYVTKPISIYNTSINNNYDTIIGGINGNAQNMGLLSGDNALPPVNKSIVLNITDLDLNYAYYQLAVIEYTDNKAIEENVYILYRSSISQEATEYTYTGINPTIDEATTVQELVAQYPDIQTAKHLVQQNNILYYAETTGRKFKWERFQQEASKIYSKYIINASEKNNISNFTPKNPGTYFYKTSYMRDEIYAFGLVWVFKDGSVSPTFHIPGRSANINPSTCLPFVQVGTSTQEQMKCLKLVLDTPVNITNCIDQFITYTISYSINGNPTVQEGTISADVNTTIYIHCSENINDNIVVNYFNTTSVSGCDYEFNYSIGIESQTVLSTVGQNKNMPLFTTYDSSNPNQTGLDYSIITQWIADINHIYPENQQAVYNALPDSEKLRFWQVYNTGYKDSDISGCMAYYECTNARYPNVRNCNNESIWGVDSCGNSLENFPIRHHKFPDAILEPIQSKKEIYNIGIDFFNIQAPTEYIDQISHFIIVRDVRNDINKTVIDKAIIDRFLYAGYEGDESESAAWLYFRSETAVDNDVPSFTTTLEMTSIFTPKSMIQRSFLGADYIKFERKYLDRSIENGGIRFEHKWCNNLSETGEASNDDMLDMLLVDFEGSTELPANNRKIIGSSYIDHPLGGLPAAGSGNVIGVTIDGQQVFNYLGSIHLYANKIQNPIVDFFDWDSNAFSLNKTLRYCGPVYYGALKRYKNVYCNLDGLQYIMVSDHPVEYSGITNSRCFGGDIFISRMDWSLQDWDESRTFFSAWIESEINSELRHGDGTVAGTRFLGDYSNMDDVCLWVTRYVNDPVWREAIEANEIKFNKFVCSDPFNYNIDFNYVESPKKFFPLSTSFDYCNSCINNHPDRIWASKQSFQEERIDSYRVILANDYIDILGGHGGITNIFIDRDRFYIHTDKDIWQLQTRPFQIQTTEDNIYVGNGQIFSIPPKKLVTTSYGYGGSKDKWATQTTEFGTIFVDRNSHKIFMLTTGLEEISQLGQRSWFENNTDILYIKDFENLTKQKYEYDSSTSALDSVGFMAVYDARYRRYILHKRDFKFTKLLVNDYRGSYVKTSNPNPRVINKIVYDVQTKTLKIVNPDGSVRSLDFQDKTLFENKSWTMSYDIVNKKWTSYHAYMPNYMFNDHDTFYTFNGLYSEIDLMNPTIINTNTWKHNEGKVGVFYNQKHSFFVDAVVNEHPLNSKTLESFKYVSRVNEYSSTHENYIERTDSPITGFYVFNSDQITSTNSVKLHDTPYESIGYDPELSIASRWMNVFSISKNLRDIAINRNTQSLFTNDWNDSNYNSNFNIDGLGNGWINKAPNELARDINKDVYQRAKLRDKWFNIRVIYNPDEDLRLSLQSIISNNNMIQ